VGVGLVPNVPNDPIGPGAEGSVQADCEFDDSEIGREVPACLGDGLDHLGSDLIGQLSELNVVEVLQIVR
jgi:hypothetical protein